MLTWCHPVYQRYWTMTLILTVWLAEGRGRSMISMNVYQVGRANCNFINQLAALCGVQYQSMWWELVFGEAIQEGKMYATYSQNPLQRVLSERALPPPSTFCLTLPYLRTGENSEVNYLWWEVTANRFQMLNRVTVFLLVCIINCKNQLALGCNSDTQSTLTDFFSSIT